ncbi:putative damage-inducible protein DinB [Pedobacter sp. CAN_A7]|uniref:DinB family protein n=1 Tax=Pedobacter sp. CAN_A7 TaxID=2787722 RepID=UPI0018CB5081
MSELIQQLWHYNNWANQLLFDALKLQREAIPPVCLLLLSHLTNAQNIWVSRITGITPAVGVWEDFTLADCEKHHHLSSNALTQVIADFKEEEHISINYTNTQNESYTNALGDILLHIFNHGTYHRAQIAAEMRKNGLVPLNTDYITFARLKN